MDAAIGSAAPALLLEAALKGGAILLLVATALLLSRRSPAAGRHLALTIAAVALLVLPALVAVGPEWGVAVLRPETADITEAPPVPVAEPVSTTAPLPEPAPFVPETVGPSPEPETERATPASVVAMEAPPASTDRATEPTTWLAWAWLVGAALFLAPLPIGWSLLIRIRRGARDLSRPDLVREVAARLGLRRAVRVVVAPDVPVPMVSGGLRSTVLLPGAASGWAEDKLRIVLFHELAHVRRWDVMTFSIARLAAAFHWLNPLAWPLLRRFRIESEKACDDAVLAAGSSPAEYSTVLLDVARESRPPRFLAAAAMPMARGGAFESRLRDILDPKRSRRAPGRSARLIAAALALVAVVALAAVHPTAVLAEDEGDVITVAKDGSGKFDSIQAAVDAAPEGATIRIAAGTYEERVVVRKPLTLEGAGWDRTRLVAPLVPVKDWSQKLALINRLLEEAKTKEERYAAVVEHGLSALPPPTLSLIEAKGVTVRGLRVDFKGDHTPGASTMGAAIGVVGSTAKLEKIAVVGSPASGILIADASDVTLADSLVAACWATGIQIRGFGIAPRVRVTGCDVRNGHHRCITVGRGCDDVVIEGCRISGSYWHGIRYDGCGPTIRGNRIEDNARCGIYASGGTTGKIEGNLFVANGMTGISFWFQGSDRVAGNTFVKNRRSGVEIIGVSAPKVERNVFSGNPTGLGLGHTSGAAGKSPGTANLVSNVFWRNQKDTMKPGGGKMVPLELPPGAGNRVEDPGFVDTAKGDWSLAKDSACRKDGIGVADPLGAASPFPVQPEETAMDEERAPDHPTPPESARPVAKDGTPARSPYEIARPWIKAITQIKSREKRQDAVVWMRGALASPDPVMQEAGLKVYSAAYQVKFDRKGFRELILPLTTKLSGSGQVSAFYGLVKTGIQEGDLELLLAAVRKKSPEMLEGSGAQLIHSYTKGNVEGEAATVIMELLAHQNYRVRKEVMRGLWGARLTMAIQDRYVELYREAEAKGQRTHDIVYFGLSTVANKTEPVVRALVDVLGDNDPNNWSRALWGLGHGVAGKGRGIAADGLLALFEARDDVHLQGRCLRLLGMYGEERHLEPLEKALENEDMMADSVRSAVKSAIASIRGREK